MKQTHSPEVIVFAIKIYYDIQCSSEVLNGFIYPLNAVVDGDVGEGGQSHCFHPLAFM
jgi:hypothetical protein